MASCTPGQGERCSHAASKRCTCQCEGSNHGKSRLTPEQQAYAEKLQAGPGETCVVCGRSTSEEVSAREVPTSKATLGETLRAIAPRPGTRDIYTIDEFPIAQIRDNPNNARLTYDMFELQALADSIALRGLQNPLSVVPIGTEDGLDIVEVRAGSRRLRAVRDLLGLAYVAVRVNEGLNDEEGDVLSLIENLQRVDLNPLEEARGYQRLHEQFGMRENAIATSVGRSASSISNALRLLRLPPDVQNLVGSLQLSQSHALAIARFEDFPAIVSRLAALAVEFKLTSHSLEAKLPEPNRLAGAKLIKQINRYEDGALYAYCQKCPFNAFRSEGETYGYCLKPEHYPEAKAEVDLHRADHAAAMAEASKSAGERARAAAVDAAPQDPDIQAGHAVAEFAAALGGTPAPSLEESPESLIGIPVGPALPKCNEDLANGTYEIISRSMPPEGCGPACECRGRAIAAYANVEKGADGLFHPTSTTQVVDVCLNPTRYRGLFDAARRSEQDEREAAVNAARSRAWHAIGMWKGEEAVALGLRIKILGAITLLGQNAGPGVPSAIQYHHQLLSRADLEWAEKAAPDPLKALHEAGINRLDAQLNRAGGEAAVLRWLLGEPEPEIPNDGEACTCGCEAERPCSHNWPGGGSDEEVFVDTPAAPCICKFCSGQDAPCDECAWWEGDLPGDDPLSHAEQAIQREVDALAGSRV